MRRSNAVALSLSCLIGIALPVAAQTDDEEWTRRCEREWGDRDRERVCEVRVERVPVRETLVIDGGANGGASIIGWDRNEIEIHARIQAQASRVDDARELVRGIRLRTDGTIEAEGPSTRRGEHWSVTFVVYAPRRTNVDLRASNGPVSARDVQGRLVLETNNGPVSLHAVAGDVRARSQNGPIRVTLAGARWDGAGLTARTQNGPVTLVIPEDYSAELETGTVNGPMRVDFPMQVTVQGRIGRTLRTTLGNGGARLDVSTHNGPLTLKRPGDAR